MNIIMDEKIRIAITIIVGEEVIISNVVLRIMAFEKSIQNLVYLKILVLGIKE